jgi:hypothetical protein
LPVFPLFRRPEIHAGEIGRDASVDVTVNADGGDDLVRLNLERAAA